jgi:hypothetical protein
MKKILFTALLLYSTSIAAIASNEGTCQQGDPKKQEKPTPTFSLAEGYFSLFSLFIQEPAKVDTTFQARRSPVRKDDASR